MDCHQADRLIDVLEGIQVAVWLIWLTLALGLVVALMKI